MNYLLDTSALLAHYLEERGGDQVGELLGQSSTNVCISALTHFEFLVTLASKGFDEQESNRALDQYSLILHGVIPVSDRIAFLATRLRSEARARIATVECLIAATAVSVGFTLVHRDAHFQALPDGLPVQLVLPEKLL